ncbi:HAMP domain-containing histidine kinase [Sulfurimonas sp. SAG-AH-194-L11]|nr:HAMP domain-containing sensor histidine kinase [Sulfurimonas sp. SAG-AH-194-L11]MDF1877867.1 HAMP domain-containing histidine kinase [Sulfurimonas sp. SAG-AH-194-L11]
MNKITKRSFYSFLALYLISSFIFLVFAAYWFFTSQVSMEMNNNFYRMTQIADKVSSQIIQAHMMNKSYTLESFPHAKVAMLGDDKQVLQGQLQDKIDFSKDFYMDKDSFTLVSNRAKGHLNVEYVIVQSNLCNKNVAALKNRVAYTVIFTALFIIVIAVFLSYMFLKPIKDKMEEIEQFVKDTTHELNTPITALMMSTSRLKSKKTYDEEINKNISISTKQLYEIYSSLSFLSFDNQKEQAQLLRFDTIVKSSVAYFSELLERKGIEIVVNLQACSLTMAPTKAKMLINNLLSNSIKYSKPNTKITLTLVNNSFTIEDEGIGIAQDKLDDIFTRFVRANSYAGGFGIGLHIVESIIKEYNFTIVIDSKENVGTKIKIDCNTQEKR